MLFTPAVVAFFKYKIAQSVIILACGNKFEQVQILRQLSRYGTSATVTCDPAILNQRQTSLQGVLYAVQPNDTIMDQVKPEYFANWNKWLIVGDKIPDKLHRIRYDADVALLNHFQTDTEKLTDTTSEGNPATIDDVYAHPAAGASRHAWAAWTQSAGLQPHGERDRILRRLNLRRYPMRIATPAGYYDEAEYGASFAEYLVDNAQPERDSATRCGYGCAALIMEALNAEEVIVQAQLWVLEAANTTSMMTEIAGGTSQLSGSILRVRLDRIDRLDYVTPIWPFIVGFTYLSERESSSNMFVMPFTRGVWCACAVVALVLALAQRATAKAPAERDGAYVAVVATCLQQDAGAVPDGASGRLAFLMMSLCSMLVYA